MTVYRSPNVVRIAKSIILRGAGHVARMGGSGTHIESWW
jgi:hypothetical protein